VVSQHFISSPNSPALPLEHNAQSQEVDLAITADLGTLQRLPYVIGHGGGLCSSLAMLWLRGTGTVVLE
jgi:hypothetical protein